MTIQKVEMSEYVPLRDVVFGNLRERIITGELQPGQRLMEIQLSNEMGVSRTPVREAIRKLHAEGLVIMNARKGAIVAPINAQDLQELLEIRKALETLACRLATRRATKEDIEKLKEINGRMADAVECGDVIDITERDVEFHELITKTAGNSHLTEMLDHIKEHIFRFRFEFIRELTDRNVLVEEHEKILAAISDGRPVDAADEVDNHIEHQEKYILQALEKEERKW